MDVIPPMLTNREHEILLALHEGASNQDIANQISLSVYTVKDHLKSIYTKLNVTSRTQALAVAREIGLLGDSKAARPHSVHQLPHLSQPLFGRDEELAVVVGLLSQPHARLITLHGPGGIGKTHLALAAAHRVVDRFPAGVFLVQLAQVTGTSGLMPAILAALDADSDPALTPIAQVIDAIGQQRTLLVLDNIEHLPDVAPLIVRLLSQTTHLRLLLTSRHTLNVPAEHVIRLRGLDSAPSGSAEQLFVYNAQRLQHTYRPTPADASLIGDICRWVNGMPLAVLMASSWMARLPLATIHRHIQTNVRQLDRPMTDILLQERSLRQIFETTWALLADAEQHAVMDTAIFADEIAYHALEAVTKLDHHTLDNLINQSLILWSPDTQRYQLHPVFKQFAQQQLQQSGRLPATQAKLFEFLIATLEAPALADSEWTLDIHDHDAVALLDTLMVAPDVPRVLRLWRGICRWWAWQGRMGELKHWFQRIYPVLDGHIAARDMGDVCERAARSLHGAADHSAVQTLLESAIQHYRTAGDSDGEISARDFLSYSLLHQGNFAAAYAIQHDNLAQSRATNKPSQILRSLAALGLVASELTHFEDAIAYNTEALAVARANQSELEADILTNLGVVYLKMGRGVQARSYFNSAIALYETSGHDPQGVVLLWANLGEVAYKEGNFAESEQYHVKALARLIEMGYTIGIIHELEAFAFLYRAQNRPIEAIHLLATAAVLRQRMGDVRTPREQIDYDAEFAQIQASVSSAEFDAAWQLGSSLPLVTMLNNLLKPYQR